MKPLSILPPHVRNKVVVKDGCWEWLGRKTVRGYAMVSYLSKTKIAHRLIYKFLVRDIPDELTLDHLCENTSCVNPDHLEPVTIQENILRSKHTLAGINARKTHCKHGHEFIPSNIYRKDNGGRSCRRCQIDNDAIRRKRKSNATPT